MSGHNNNLWKEIKQNIFLSQKKENDCEMCRLFKLKNDYNIFYTFLSHMSNFFHPKFKGKIKFYMYIYIYILLTFSNILFNEFSILFYLISVLILYHFLMETSTQIERNYLIFEKEILKSN